MKNEEIILRNTDIKEIREEALKEIFSDKTLPSSILSAIDLDIYSKNNNFFDKLEKAFKKSCLDTQIILTNEQMRCLELLSKGNLFISAPTSFGKTFIALEFISRNIDLLNNIIFIVPTIALMNELRKKCFKYFGDIFVIITSEAELEKNTSLNKKIMILVPERINTKMVKSYLDRTSIDFVVYDEIYKLNANLDKDDSRLIIMNYTYKYIIENAKKILLLGPFIKNAKFDRSNIPIQKYITNLNLVYNEISENLSEINYFGNTNEKQFIYFNSPRNITNFLKQNEENKNKLENVDYDEEIVEWMSKNVHENWYYIDYLKKGIGIHHGNTPIFLRKYIEDEYANGFINTILCTSTLIEGINTPTNKLIVYDVPRGIFELNNLIGRVGRLNVNKPKKGKIYFAKEEIKQLYDPNEWIELNILFEQDEMITRNKEDERLYLEKIADEEIEKNINNLEEKLKKTYNIEYSEVIELGIEFKVLNNFLKYFEKLVNNDSEFDVITIIKFSVIPGNKAYLSGLKMNNYSFGKGESKEKYLELDPVYLLLVSTDGIKDVIDRFTDKYNMSTIEDINYFIDTLFKVEEFIKFQLSKIIPVFNLFDGHQLLDKEKNKVFIQCIHLIESYGSVTDGYERILEDMGFPSEDIILMINEIDKYGEETGTERKLIKIRNDREVFEKLSPFGRKIIDSYINK